MKTLKDIDPWAVPKDFHYSGDTVIDISEVMFLQLRQASIEWIKENNSELFDLYLDIFNNEKDESEYDADTRINTTKRFIKHFFNITEEELK